MNPYQKSNSLAEASARQGTRNVTTAIDKFATEDDAGINEVGSTHQNFNMTEQKSIFSPGMNS